MPEIMPPLVRRGQACGGRVLVVVAILLLVVPTTSLIVPLAHKSNRRCSTSGCSRTSRMSPLFAATSDEVAATTTMAHSKPIYNVIVVGAGLAGLAVSLGLAQTGLFTVDIVEKKQKLTERGATLGLRPNGLRALQELCGNGKNKNDNNSSSVVDTLHAQSIPLPPPRGGLMLPWGTVRDALLSAVQDKAEAADQTSVITLHMGYDLEDIVDDADASAVQATFRRRMSSGDDLKINSNDRDNQNTLTLRGCCVLGCDGVASAVRQQHLVLPAAFETGVTLWRGSVTVNTDATLSSSNSLVAPLLEQGIVPLGTRMYGPYVFMAFNFHQVQPGCLAWSCTTKEPQLSQQSEPRSETVPSTSLWTLLEPHIESADERAMIYELLHLSNPADLSRALPLRTIDPSRIETSMTDKDSGRPTTMPHKRRPGWGGRGRVTLLGDSAHAVRPASGMGGALAFEDCVVLCRHLTAAAASSTDSNSATLEDYATVSSILQAFEAERLPRVSTIWDREWQMSEAAYSSSSSIPSPQTTADYDEFVNAGV